MKGWILLALGGVIVIAYSYVYLLSGRGSGGAASVGIANLAGLVMVCVGIVAAGFILRRSEVPK